MTPHVFRIDELLIAEALLELAMLSFQREFHSSSPELLHPIVCAAYLHELRHFPEYWPPIDVLKLAAPFARDAALRTLKARP